MARASVAGVGRDGGFSKRCHTTLSSEEHVRTQSEHGVGHLCDMCALSQ
jgi:hypothetical protein